MHFVLHKDIRQNQTIRWLLVVYLVSIILFLLFMPLLEHWGLGLWPEDLIRQVRGSSAAYLEPKSMADLVLDIHIKLFLHSIMGLILTVVATRTRLRLIRPAMLVLFMFPILEFLMLIALSLFSPLWAYPKVLVFVSLWLVQLSLALYLLNFVRRRP